MENRDLGIEFSIVMPGVVNTELGAGLPESKGVKVAEPEDVADAIVETLKVPRLEVYVPKELGPLHKFAYVLPRRAQEWMARRFKADRVLIDADHAHRAAYEQRAAESEPQVTGGEPEHAGARGRDAV
jgi:hypothetical protein